MVQMVGKQRDVQILPLDDRRDIARRCSEMIHQHISLLNNMCEVKTHFLLPWSMFQQLMPRDNARA